ncbi:alanine racemase [Pseudomonas saudimassiliensis]|uniref:Alanine racemase n=1 Tax=Pseudomonas saudimassiliensis TaxID=1461581 RepID=A0A078MJA3_9PSED|nr:alanine racemase [Pseudomonas saudimassiliensis]CEA04786.1 alanine racemase [Pseudomonas saudimassiliensis]CEF26795.1 alanine racemase [Pseudomonas saudimassiliensis]
MRPAHALIDLSALRHNYRLAKSLTGCRALAVVKANAYGHGAVECAAALGEEADGFAVSAIEEALVLRAAGHRQPIVLLEGWFEPAELELICQHDLWPVIHHHGQVADLRVANLRQPLNAWLKLDSGMHRTGFSVAEYPQVWRELQASGKVASLTKITHFARADEPETGRTEQQLETFMQATAGLEGPCSLSNSAGVLAWPSAYGDWVRPGIMLYGSSPFGFAQEQAAQLRPVMQLDSRVIAVHDIAAGEPIGYGSRFVTQRPSRIGVVAMGYADGYPRHAPDGTPVLVDGQRTCISGRVSMDMLTVDLTDLPASGLGSHVRLWGEGLDAGEVAQCAGTISYQLFCNLNRVPRHYRG